MRVAVRWTWRTGPRGRRAPVTRPADPRARERRPFRARADPGHFEPPDPERGSRHRGGLGGGGTVRPVLARTVRAGRTVRGRGVTPGPWTVVTYGVFWTGVVGGGGVRGVGGVGVGGVGGAWDVFGWGGAARTAGAVPAARTPVARTGVIVIGRAGRERLVELLLVQLRRVERLAPAAVRQRQPGRGPDVLGVHFQPALPGRMGQRGPRDDQVGPQPVHPERGTHRRHLAQRGIWQHYPGQRPPRRRDPPGQRGLGHLPAGPEPVWVRVVVQPAAHHLGARPRVTRRGRLDGQPEPVQELRAQLPFFRVHGADQQEPGGVPHRHAVPLHVADAQRRRVEEQVDQVVVQQVDLVHVQHAAVRRGQQPWLVRLDPLGQRPLDVQRAEQPVLAGPHGQLDQPGRPGPRPRSSRGAGLVRAVRAVRVGVRGVAGEPAARHHVHVREDRGQRAHHRRLRGALLAPDQHAADGRGHGVEHERQPQLVHADHRAEREPGAPQARAGNVAAHSPSPSSWPSSSR